LVLQLSVFICVLALHLRTTKKKILVFFNTIQKTKKEILKTEIFMLNFSRKSILNRKLFEKNA